jgi:hypothetical protein
VWISHFCFVKFSTNVKKKKKKKKEYYSISCSLFWGKESPNFEKKLGFSWVTFLLEFWREWGGGGHFLKPTFQLFGHVLETCCHLMLNLS